jgi:hypothetical protein
LELEEVKKIQMKYYLLSVIVLLMITSCSTAEEDMQSEWVKFPSSVKAEVYNLIEEKDCRGLQDYFDFTGDNFDRIVNRGGQSSKHLRLMGFIDEK